MNPDYRFFRPLVFHCCSSSQWACTPMRIVDSWDKSKSTGQKKRQCPACMTGRSIAPSAAGFPITIMVKLSTNVDGFSPPGPILVKLDVYGLLGKRGSGHCYMIVIGNPAADVDFDLSHESTMRIGVQAYCEELQQWKTRGRKKR
ncbi:hypothetical protein V8E54_008958 [Elaphomyces granulatus]